MNTFVLKTSRIAKKILPNWIFSFIKKYYDDQEKKKCKRIQLKMYNKCCNYFPGFILLDEYVKTDRMFDGVQYYSQMYQDYFLDKFIFKEKENGFFIDVGGNDPVHINNTYFFEKNRKWSGIAIEPMPELNEKWKTQRKVECILTAVGNQPGETEFCQYKEHYMSGLSDAVDFNGAIEKKYKVKVSVLKDIMAEREITHVDFMSLDVEGVEFEALQGIDFDKVTIDYIAVENDINSKRAERVRKYLIDKGYTLIARLWIDDIWTRIKPCHYVID